MTDSTVPAQVTASAPVQLDASTLVDPRASSFGRMLERAVDDNNLPAMQEICTLIASTDFCPKDYQGKPANVMVAIDLGRAVGLPPLQSLQTIAVINGRPSIYGDGLLAVILARGGDVEETPHIDEPTGEVVGWTCRAIRPGHADKVQTYTIDDAKRANLWGKSGPWKTNPGRMMQFRARGFAARDQFADWLNGMITTEEARDIIDVDPETGEILRGGPVPAPRQASQEPAGGSHSDRVLSGLKRERDTAADADVGDAAETPTALEIPADPPSAAVIVANIDKCSTPDHCNFVGMVIEKHRDHYSEQALAEFELILATRRQEIGE